MQNAVGFDHGSSSAAAVSPHWKVCTADWIKFRARSTRTGICGAALRRLTIRARRRLVPANIAAGRGAQKTVEDVMPMIARRSFLIGTALAPLVPALARAQGARPASPAWPTRPVTLIIPFPAGGAMDVLGRNVAHELGDKLGQPLVVDNRVGAAGNIGAMAAAKAAPDGYTILMAGAASLALNKFMFGNMPYDPDRELTPIVIVSRLPHIFVVNPKVEAKTLKELVAYAKAHPGKLNAGVPGTGTTAHITLEAFMAETGAKMTVVTYRAEPQMLTDLLGGQLDFACTLTTSPGPHVQDGRLRALAVTSAQRTRQLPEVPTVEQSGFPGFEATAWFALAAPAGTPADIIDKLNAGANAFIRSEQGQQELDKLDSLPAGGTPAQAKAFIAAEARKWGPIIKAANIRM
jgi:tripartite-type tricarboxylate transporter receptor subunit TctC